MKITSIFTDEELALIDSGKYTPGRAVLDAKLDLAMALEREACAKLADEYIEGCEGTNFGVGKVIRARGQA
jgi:hypothetical protein